MLEVCGVDVPPEDRDFVGLYPQLDPRLVSRQELAYSIYSIVLVSALIGH
jgi:hypothetical protein